MQRHLWLLSSDAVKNFIENHLSLQGTVPPKYLTLAYLNTTITDAK